MDLLRENSESEDLLTGKQPQLKECPVGQWKRREEKKSGSTGPSEGVKQSECQLDTEDFGKVQRLWRFQGSSRATKFTEQKLNSLEDH